MDDRLTRLRDQPFCVGEGRREKLILVRLMPHPLSTAGCVSLEGFSAHGCGSGRTSICVALRSELRAVDFGQSCG